MTKTETINIRVEPKLKRSRRNIKWTRNEYSRCSYYIFKASCINRKYSFYDKKPKFNDEMLEAIAEANRMMKNPDKYKTFNSVDELMEDLNDNE